MPQPNIPPSRQIATSNFFEIALFTIMVGVIAAVVLIVMWEYDLVSGAFVGGGAGVLAGIVLAILLRRPRQKPADGPIGRAPRASAGREGAVVPARDGPAGGAPATTLAARGLAGADSAGVGRPATAQARSPLDPAELPVAGAGGPMAARGERAEADAEDEPRRSAPRTSATTADAGTSAAAPSATTPSAQPYEPGSGSGPIVKPATARGAPESLDDTRPDGPEPVKPPMRDAPREEGPDDLTRIRGIGPALEGMLHRMGVYHFDQIASWSPAEVAWADENLEDFKGRVTRDDWVGQARALEAEKTA